MFAIIVIIIIIECGYLAKLKAKVLGGGEGRISDFRVLQLN